MNLADKMGELDNNKKIFGYEITKIGEDFTITVWITNKTLGGPHSINTKQHPSLIKAVDEALEIYREHLSDCSLC